MESSLHYQSTQKPQCWNILRRYYLETSLNLFVGHKDIKIFERHTSLILNIDSKLPGSLADGRCPSSPINCSRGHWAASVSFHSMLLHTRNSKGSHPARTNTNKYEHSSVHGRMHVLRLQARLPWSACHSTNLWRRATRRLLHESAALRCFITCHGWS